MRSCSRRAWSRCCMRSGASSSRGSARRCRSPRPPGRRRALPVRPQSHVPGRRATIVGQALLLGQPILLLYAVVFAAAVAAFVHWYEEPTLRKQFGEQYEAYQRAVPPGGRAANRGTVSDADTVRRDGVPPRAPDRPRPPAGARPRGEQALLPSGARGPRPRARPGERDRVLVGRAVRHGRRRADDGRPPRVPGGRSGRGRPLPRRGAGGGRQRQRPPGASDLPPGLLRRVRARSGREQRRGGLPRADDAHGRLGRRHPA